MVTGTMILAAAVTALASMLLGWAWYSPAFFGKQWMQAVGIDSSNPEVASAMKQAMGKSFLGGYLTALLRVMVLIVMYLFIGVTTLPMALAVALLLAIGYQLTGVIEHVLWEMRSGKLVFIHGLFALVENGIISVILYLWLLA